MTYLWNRVRNIMALVGLGLCYIAASTSDFHVMGLGQAEPGKVWWMLVVGVVMMMPTAVHAVRGGR